MSKTSRSTKETNNRKQFNKITSKVARRGNFVGGLSEETKQELSNFFDYICSLKGKFIELFNEYTKEHNRIRDSKGKPYATEEMLLKLFIRKLCTSYKQNLIKKYIENLNNIELSKETINELTAFLDLLCSEESREGIIEGYYEFKVKRTENTLSDFIDLFCLHKKDLFQLYYNSTELDEDVEEGINNKQNLLEMGKDIETQIDNIFRYDSTRKLANLNIVWEYPIENDIFGRLRLNTVDENIREKIEIFNVKIDNFEELYSRYVKLLDFDIDKLNNDELNSKEDELYIFSIEFLKNIKILQSEFDELLKSIKKQLHNNRASSRSVQPASFASLESSKHLARLVSLPPSHARRASQQSKKRGGKPPPKYKSTGRIVCIMYKKRKYKRTVYTKDKRDTKYCKIDGEYILLSKMKVIEND